MRNARDAPGASRAPDQSDGRDIPWWGTVSSAAAPVLLVTGLTAAAKLQPPKFGAFNNTVSALAGEGASYGWVMTLTFLVVGVCDVVTGLALRAAALKGRLVLIGAGVAGAGPLAAHRGGVLPAEPGGA